MATRFAVKTGVWSDVTTWDNGALPVAGDKVHPNGFTVTIDTDINVDSLNNNVSNIYVPNIATPAMTGDSQPSGIAIASGYVVGANPYIAFNQIVNTANYWLVTGNSGWLGYTFPTSKIIKRYFIRITNTNNWNPKTFYFEGSNDGFATAGVQLDYVAAATNAVNYLSVLLTNNTAYTSYRVRVTATQGSAGYCGISQLEMTESSGTVFGASGGGSFTVPASLSGTRNIQFTGAGLQSYAAFASNLLTLDNNLTNTVNINKTSGAFIINPLFNGSSGSSSGATAININNNGIVNINGDIYGTTLDGAAAPLGLIRVVSNSTITVNGNLYPLAGRSNVVSYLFNFLSSSTNSTLTINGDVIGGNLYSNTYALFIQSVNTVNITGNLTSNAGYCYYSTTASFLNLTGSANLTNINSVPCVFMNSATSLLTMNGAIINKGNVMAVSVQKMRYVSTATPYWIFQTTGASDITLAYGAATGAYPNEADVRFGTNYSASPTRTGTLRVPLPQYVSQGVLTDNTVGTAYLDATDVWNVLTSSITTAGSIGERLKNASTVQTNGDQLAAYIV